MISRIQTAEDVFVDGRVIPVAIIGLFEGWWAGLIAALAAAAYRVWLGGRGAADAVGRLSRIVRIERTHHIGTLPAMLDTERSTAKPRDDAGR